MNYDEAKKKLDDFQDTMLERLIKTARQRGKLIFYSDLICGSGVEDFLDSSREVRNAISTVLDSIALETVKQNGIMLTAVVVRRTDSVPSRGFYAFAVTHCNLPPDSSEKDKEAFWSNELKKVYQYYQKEKQS